MKLEHLLHDIKSRVVFGPCNAGTLQNYICKSIFMLFTISCLIFFYFSLNSFVNFKSVDFPMLTSYFGF
jgi:hypothetical protein